MMGQKVLSSLAKTGKTLLWAAGAMVFPVSISLKKNAMYLGRTARKVAVYALGWNVLVPGSVLLFPRMEKELEAQGLDPRLAAELAPGARIHVMKDDLPGKVATFAAASSRWGWIASVGDWMYAAELIRGTPTAFAQSSLSNSFGNVCAVYIKTDTDRRADEKKRQVEAASGGRMIFISPLTHAERRALTTLHETVHCGGDNEALPSGVTQEGHADFMAAEGLARARGPEMREKVLRQRLMFDGNPDLNTALYLDAAFRRAALPSKGEIDAANAQAQHLVGLEASLKKAGVADQTQVFTVCVNPVQCERPPPILSDLAERRVQLWREHKGAMLRPK